MDLEDQESACWIISASNRDAVINSKAEGPLPLSSTFTKNPIDIGGTVQAHFWPCG